MGVDMDFSKLGARDVLDLAIYVEDEAEGNYLQLVTWMERHGNAEAASLFKRMAGLEELHRQQIATLRRKLFGDQTTSHTDAYAWEVENPDWDAIGPDLTLRQAYAIAVGAETRAHDYYAGALEYASDPQVTELLETLRDAELAHRRLLEGEMAKRLG